MNQPKQSAPHPGTGSAVGRGSVRREDDSLLTGQAAFTDDIRVEHALFLRFVRSDYASGDLVAIDTEAALAAPGVAGVFTGEQVAHLGSLTVNRMLEHNDWPDSPLMAVDQVQAVGQPIAAIVADSAQHADDAVELVQYTVDEQPPVLFSSAAGRDAPDSCELPPTVMSSEYCVGDWDEAVGRAGHVVRARIEHPRLLPTPMENRAVVVDVDPDSGELTIWLSTQTPHRARQELARILAIDPAQLRVVARHVGGAFGLKGSLYPEEILAVWIAVQLGRAVRWVATRGEDMVSATHGRGCHSSGSLALDAEGRFLALKADMMCPLGHWLPTSAAVPAWNAGRILPGPYDIPVTHVSTRAVQTNTAAVGIYRGAGRPEAAMLMERLVDMAGEAAGLSPFEVRQRNLLQADQLPHRGASGRELDAGDYPAALDMVSRAANINDLHRDIMRRRAGGELVGCGLACYVEPSGQGWESASVTLQVDGRIVAATGSSAQGQGRESAYAQIVADVFAVPVEMVEVRVGDTATCPPGIGALASRSTPIGGSAILQAAQQVRDQAGERAGNGPVTATVKYEAPSEAWGYGCYLALVSVDDQTGQVSVERVWCVDDVGLQINPVLIKGQIAGGVTQGLGEVLMERVAYDTAGQLLTGSLMDYAVPRAIDVPPVEMHSLHTPTSVNLLGAKGVGEAGTIGCPAAVLNAVYDALSGLGVSDLSLPLAPETVWRAIQQARGRRHPDE